MLCEQLERERVDRPLRLAAGGEGTGSGRAPSLRRIAFGEDRARGIAGAEEQNVVDVRSDMAFALSASAAARRAGLSISGAQISGRPPQQSLSRNRHDSLKLREIGAVDDRTADAARGDEPGTRQYRQDAPTWCFAGRPEPWRCRPPQVHRARASPAGGRRPAGWTAPAPPAQGWQFLIPYIQIYGYIGGLSIGLPGSIQCLFRYF